MVVVAGEIAFVVSAMVTVIAVAMAIIAMVICSRNNISNRCRRRNRINT